MLQAIIQRTKDFIAKAPKEDRKRYGQFFTSERTAQGKWFDKMNKSK